MRRFIRLLLHVHLRDYLTSAQARVLWIFLSANKEQRFGVPQLYQHQWAHDIQLASKDALSDDFAWMINGVETQAKVQILSLVRERGLRVVPEEQADAPDIDEDD